MQTKQPLSRPCIAWAQAWASLSEAHQYALRSELYTADLVDAEHFAVTYDRYLEGVHPGSHQEGKDIRSDTWQTDTRLQLSAPLR